MAAERFFTQIAQEVLEATERISNHLDTNLNFLFFGGHNNSISSGTDDNHSESLNESDDVEEANPLQGMAEQVLNGIMDGQVCMCTRG